MFTGILYTHIFYALGGSEMPNGQNLRPIAAGSGPAHPIISSLYCYRSLALPAEAPLDHNFRYPRIREHSVDNDGIALGGRSFSFSSLLFSFPSLLIPGSIPRFFDRHLGIESYCY